jgi:hypothetical protein
MAQCAEFALNGRREIPGDATRNLFISDPQSFDQGLEEFFACSRGFFIRAGIVGFCFGLADAHIE